MKLHALFDKFNIAAEIHQRIRPEEFKHIGAKLRWYVTFASTDTVSVWDNRTGAFRKFSLDGAGPTPAAAWAKTAKFLSGKWLLFKGYGLAPVQIAPEKYTP